MKLYRQSLPPLEALVFFESAARYRNFTRAASELYVSQAAVSKRIKQLEDWIGVTLFERYGRMIELTESGLQLSEKVAMGLDYLEAALLSTRGLSRTSIRIAANSAVSTCWLSPRIKAFGLHRSPCAVDLFTSDRTGDLFSPEHDLAVLYMKKPLPGWEMHLIGAEELFPVAAPSVAAQIIDAGEASFQAPWPDSGLSLLEYERNAPDWVNWERWGERLNIPGISRWPRLICGSWSLSIGKALRGEGVALGSMLLLEEELRQGNLVRIGTNSLKTGYAYYISYRSEKNISEDIRSIVSFLLQHN